MGVCGSKISLFKVFFFFFLNYSQSVCFVSSLDSRKYEGGLLWVTAVCIRDKLALPIAIETGADAVEVIHIVIERATGSVFKA